MSGGLIEDGKGRGFKASVSSFLRLNVSSKSNPRIYYNSRVLGSAFTFVSEYSATSGDYVLYIKNTSTVNSLVISGVWASADENAKWCIEKVEGVASGTDVVANPLNFSKKTTATADIKGSAAVTGLTKEATVAASRSMANTTIPMQFEDALIIGSSTAIAIKYIGTAGDVSVTVGGHFEPHSEGVV